MSIKIPFYVAQSQVIFEYEKNLNIRKSVFDYEDKLKEYFKTPFTLINIPDEVHPELPRFEAMSHNLHSKIQATQQRLTLTTVYDNNFSSKKNEIQEYISDRVKLIEDLIKKEKIHFIAYIIELGFEMKVDEINGFIKEQTNSGAITKDTVDFTLAYSYPLNNRFYLNIKCSKYVNQPVAVDFNTNRLQKIGDPTYGISITIDLNSKYQNEKGMNFEQKLFTEIGETIFEIISNNEIENYLKGDIKL